MGKEVSVRTSRSRRRPGIAVLSAVAVGFLVLAACGSEVEPKDFCGAGGNCGAGAVGAGNNAPGDLAGGGGTAGAPAGPTSGRGNGGGAGGGKSSGSSGGGTVGGSGHGAGGGGTAGATGGGAGARGGSGGDAAGGVRAGSCAGFRNSTGITNSTITIANVADLSGPVPGLFKSAQAAVTAYVSYFNATSSICGRKLKLIGLDSGTSESGDQQASQTGCSRAFALVGSMGAFDSGGARTTGGCGQPDLRAAATETARFKNPTTFGAYSLAVPEVPVAQFSYFKSLDKNAAANAAFVYLNAGASSLNAESAMKAESKIGFHWKDTVAIDVTSVPNYNLYANQLKSHGIKYVQYIGAYQYAVKLKSAFSGAGYNPIFVMDPTAYDAGYVSAGAPVNGTYSFVPGPLFEEANRNPALSTYLTWLNRTSGGAPSFFGVYAWSAAALFTEKAVQLGGKLTRASLVNAVRGVQSWTANKMTPPQDPGGKHTAHCMSVVHLQNGRWVRKTPYPYTCGSVINSGVGG
jgi:hypothetical protein